MTLSRRLSVAFICTIVCAGAFTASAQCDMNPWTIRELSDEDRARLARSKAAECIQPITHMTGAALLNSGRPPPVRVSLARYEFGHYLRLTHALGGSGKLIVGRTEDPLVFGFEDGTHLSLHLACPTSYESGFFDGFYELTHEQITKISQRPITSIRQYMPYAGQRSRNIRKTKTVDGLVDIELLHKKRTGETIERLSGCMLQSLGSSARERASKE